MQTAQETQLSLTSRARHHTVVLPNTWSIRWRKWILH